MEYTPAEYGLWISMPHLGKLPVYSYKVSAKFYCNKAYFLE